MHHGWIGEKEEMIVAEDQLFYLCHYVIDGIQERPTKKQLLSSWTWHQTLTQFGSKNIIEIAYKHGIRGNALILIANFLKCKKFKVSYSEKHSKDKKSWTGVPQCSVFCPLLFLLYVNNIHQHLPKEMKIACYADDIVIHTQAQICKILRHA